MRQEVYSKGKEMHNEMVISIVVIQVTKSNSPTTATSKKVSTNDCDNDRQPEIAMWPPKTEILTSLELS